MVTAKNGIFDSKTAGFGNPGARSAEYYKLGNATGTPGIAAQRNALNMFGQAAQGQGPSLAQSMLTQQSGQIQRGNMSMMQGARGGNIAGAYNTALGANAGQQAGLAQQAAVVQAQEQLANRQAYAQQAAQMAQQQLAYEQLAQQGLATSGQQNIDWQLGRGQLDLNRDQFDWQRNMGIGNMILGGVSALGSIVGGGATSDVRAKEDMQPFDPAAAAAEVQPLAYRYKPGMGQPEGQQLGVSAQQLAGTSLGSTLVGQDANGMLNVDGGRAGIAALAASGENARRLRMLEQQLAEQSEHGSLAQRYGTREEGMANTRRAQMLSDDISAQRGAAQVQRGQGGPAYDFRGSPQMSRGVASQTIDPFTQNTVGPNTTQGIAGLRSRYFPELVR